MRVIYKYISGLIVGGLLFSCADDGVINNGGNEAPEGDTPYYINLRLITQDGSFTRAGDEAEQKDPSLVDGDHDEHEISPDAYNFALFFDSDKNYITYANLYSVNEAGYGNDEEHGQETSPVPVESTYSCRFYGFANRKPKYVMVVVNAPEKIYTQVTNFPGWNVDEVMGQVWTESGRAKLEANGDYKFYGDDPYDNMGFFKTNETKVVENETKVEEVKYFTMTNSTYVKGSEVYCAEEIPDENITSDPDKVKTLSPVKIYLERMVPKFSLALSFNYNEYLPTTAQSLDVCQYTYDPGTNTSSFKYYDYPWAIRLLSWGMNGLETKNYLFKNVTESGDWILHDGWNSPSDKRSYWSVDPHYYREDAFYPWQYDDARDQYDEDYGDWYNNFQFYGNDDQEYALTYYPFTYFCSGGVDGEGKGNTKDLYTKSPAVIYSPENTFDPGLQIDPSKGTRAYELAGTHLLICAQLLLDPDGGTDYDVFEGNIYRNRVGVTYINDFSMFEDFVNAVNYKLRSQKNIYYKYYPWDKDIVSDFHHPDKEPDKEKKYGMNYGIDFRTNSEGEYVLFYQNPDDGKYYEITPYIINKLATDQDHYMLSREADAINADGKVIPWIMYNSKGKEGTIEDFSALDLFIFNKDKISGVIDEEIAGYILDENYDISNLRMEFQYKDKASNTWKKFPNYNDRDDNDLQSIFFEIWGVADCYNHGLMYYAIPVHAQEYNGTPASGDKKTLEDTSSGLNDPMFYYYYGVVRNNWYKFTLHSIGAPGYPVSVPYKPIVPNYVFKKDQVKVEMEILPMHVQDIDVPM